MATMKDVAKLAGVSVGSVSNVFNGIKVKQDTYDKVTAAAKELNFETNNLARSFKLNHTNTIALIVPTIWHPFFSSIAFYLEEIAEKKGYHVFLCNSNDNETTELKYIKMLRKNKVDGIIAITYKDIDAYMESSLPFVSIDRHFNKGVSIVSSDNYNGGRLAAQTLSEKQAKKLLFVGTHNAFSNETMKRRQGFEDYCVEHKIDYHVIDLLEPHTDFTSELLEMMDAHKEIDGIFSINDFVGLNIINILKELGKEVVKDYQLIGFDGIKMSKEREYEVSTIVQPVKEIAYSAFNILMKQIENPDYKAQQILPIQFAEGGTTR
ncbi:LacI family DNA-binding transcriptional regulator [Aerococcus sp. NPDC058936]|uniref:LacI family DNA-binding transcriptional regulator n=1 Tax=Aerococcus sp. NPDC058936 TaxID=3346674 RepID=UPI00366CA23A